MSKKGNHAVQHWTPTTLIFSLLLAHANPSWSASIVNVKVDETADETALMIEFDEPLKQSARLFKVGNPDRQVVDFSEELSAKDFSAKFSSDSRVKSAQFVAAQGRSRIVFDMANPYELRKVDTAKTLKLVFSGPRPFKPGSEVASNLAPNAQLQPVVAKAIDKPLVSAPTPSLTAWEWGSEGGQPLLRLTFDKPEVRMDSFVRKDLLRLRIPLGRVAVGVPDTLADSPSASVSRVRLIPGDQVLTVSAQFKDVTHRVRQSGNVVEVLFEPERPMLTAKVDPLAVPVSMAAAKAGMSGPVLLSGTPVSKQGSEVLSNSSRYTGKPISLDFKNADIRTVLQVFADFTRMNLVVSDSVQGKVTVHLKDVPWDQALEIVMRSKGLVSSQSGNVLLVSSPADAASDQLDSANRRAKDDMEPLMVRTFVVSYQKTADVVALLKDKDSKMLSARGTILSDERTSQIFVEDTPSRIDRIVSIIESMDKPVKQVMIEARVVLADTSVSKELGVRLRSASARSEEFTEISDQFGSKGYANTGPGSSTNLAYTLFNARSTRLINIQLRALETQNKIRTVSNPRVITSNKEPAVIEQGTEIPYQIATSSGATAIEFKEANLKLEVTPQISPDGAVLLDVNVSKDSLGITTANGPAIDTRRVKTKVLVTDGGTVVLGGIFEEDDNELRNKTPFLGDIPVVGNLFKSKSDSKRRAELLIFLTPVVLQDS